MNLLSAALAYAARGWPVFPCNRYKRPCTDHGFYDATTDADRIRQWWQRWPYAWPAAPTGHLFVVLDVDVPLGRATLATLGFAELPLTPTARSPSGGWHLYFLPPMPPIRNTQGEHGSGIGTGLDWRGVGGQIILPAPGNRYRWQVQAVPFASVPPALLPRQRTYDLAIGEAATTTVLTDYGEAALLSAAEKILAAPNRLQEAVLNSECFSIGRLAGAGGVPPELAIEILVKAAKRMVNHKAKEPWKADKLEQKVRKAVEAGMAKPRAVWRDPLEGTP